MNVENVERPLPAPDPTMRLHFSTRQKFHTAVARRIAAPVADRHVEVPAATYRPDESPLIPAFQCAGFVR